MEKLIVAIFVLFLSACASGPSSYDELVEEAEATGDYAKVRKFERDVERAEMFFRAKKACTGELGRIWYCDARGSSFGRIGDGEPKRVWDRVRKYRIEKHQCGCVKKEALFRW